MQENQPSIDRGEQFAQTAPDVTDKGKSVYTIGELSKEFDVTLRTLRFYEDKGLLNPNRRGTTRLYSRRDRSRLNLIQMGKRVGFSLDQIKEMLDLYDLGDAQVPQLKVALTRFEEQISRLKQQRIDIDRVIDEMQRTHTVIAGMLRQKQSPNND